MRATQLATLRAIQAGADTIHLVSERMGIPYSSAANRLRLLTRDYYLELQTVEDANCYSLTDKARSLLAERDRLDGAP